MTKRTVSLLVGDRTVCERCDVADMPWSRMRGLLGRSDLPRGEGILLRPAASVHTFFMRFPIDVVFLDEHDHVVEIASDLPVWRAAGKKGAKSVLELPAGEAAARGIAVGDRLEFSERPPEHIAVSQAAQTMAEYVVVLAVVTSAVIIALTFLSAGVVNAVSRVVDLLS